MSQSNTQLETSIFGQVTQKQRCFETFDTTKIYNAAFKIVPYSNNSLTEEMFANIQTRKVQKQFVCQQYYRFVTNTTLSALMAKKFHAYDSQYYENRCPCYLQEYQQSNPDSTPSPAKTVNVKHIRTSDHRQDTSAKITDSALMCYLCLRGGQLRTCMFGPLCSPH